MLRHSPHRPIILAHRGASAVAPENTITAFRAAKDLGADGIELDVTLTSDHVPVVIHDDTVDRTTNGHGRVRAMTLAEIKRLDAGAWKDESFRGEAIPTLAEVFEGLGEWMMPAGHARGALVNVELKSTGIRTDGVERQVVKLINERNLEGSVILSSFNPLALARARILNPRLARGLLYDPSQPFYLRRAWLRFLAAPNALHPEHKMIGAGFMRFANHGGYLVNTWTVDEPDEALRLAALGVNAVITNKPEVVRGAFSKVDDS